MVSLCLCCNESNAWDMVEGPWRGLCWLKKPFMVWDQGIGVAGRNERDQCPYRWADHTLYKSIIFYQKTGGNNWVSGHTLRGVQTCARSPEGRAGCHTSLASTALGSCSPAQGVDRPSDAAPSTSGSCLPQSCASTPGPCCWPCCCCCCSCYCRTSCHSREAFQGLPRLMRKRWWRLTWSTWGFRGRNTSRKRSHGTSSPTTTTSRPAAWRSSSRRRPRDRSSTRGSSEFDARGKRISWNWEKISSNSYGPLRPHKTSSLWWMPKLTAIFI